MRREIPALRDVPLSPTQVKHLRAHAEYGETVRVRLLCMIPVIMIEWYQRKTVDREHVCVFEPSCSEYSRLAYLRYGFIMASFLTIERLKVCNNFTEWPHYNKP